MPDFGNPFSGVDLDRKLNKEELLRALRFTVAAEFEAVQLYTQIASATDDQDVQKVMRDVADEELVHAGEFMALVKKINPEEEKLYQEGESETQDMIKKSYEGIQAFQIARRIDKVAEGLQEQDPQTALILDSISDRLELAYKKDANPFSKQDIQRNRLALVDLLRTVDGEKRKPLINVIQFLLKLETQI